MRAETLVGEVDIHLVAAEDAAQGGVGGHRNHVAQAADRGLVRVLGRGAEQAHVEQEAVLGDAAALAEAEGAGAKAVPHRRQG